MVASIPESLPVLDRINRRAYRTRGVLRQFGTATGWLEPGEELAVRLVADSVGGAAILDIGIGGGRTAPLLRAISPDYRGIDYTPSMVALAKQRFPDVTFLEMDARSLAFPDAAFALVTFTFNGIDSIDLQGRRGVLREVFRVLRPGGYFVFSSLNRPEAALARRWPDWTVFRGAGKSPARLLRGCARLLVGGFNRLRRQRLILESENAAVSPLPAHNFALLTVFVALQEQLRELRDAGFVLDAMFEPRGRRLQPDEAQETHAPWFYYVARKP